MTDFPGKSNSSAPVTLAKSPDGGEVPEVEAEMIEGSCHCGLDRWRFEAAPETVTACNCTLCRRYGTLWAYDFEGERIHVFGPARACIRSKMIEFHRSATSRAVYRGLVEAIFLPLPVYLFACLSVRLDPAS